MDPKVIPYLALWISAAALCFTMVNATVGIINFCLNRCRLLKVVELSSHFTEHIAKGQFYAMEIDLLSYGAAIWDLKVVLKIQVEPTGNTVLDGTCGEYTFDFSPKGDLPNPLNAGKGVRFVAERYHKKEPMEECIARFRAARLRDVCIEISCSDGRKVLKRLCNRDTHRKIDQFLGEPRKVGWSKLEAWLATWRINREIKQSRRATEEAKKLAEKEGIEVPPGGLHYARKLHQRRKQGA